MKTPEQIKAMTTTMISAPHVWVIVNTCREGYGGYWGRGPTLAEALKTLEGQGCDRMGKYWVCLVLGDALATCDAFNGAIHFKEGSDCPTLWNDKRPGLMRAMKHLQETGELMVRMYTLNHPQPTVEVEG